MSAVFLHFSSSHWYFSFRSFTTFSENAKPMGDLFVSPASAAPESVLPCKAKFLLKRQLLSYTADDFEDKLYFRARYIEKGAVLRFSAGL